jgi:hypothetical protein
MSNFLKTATRPQNKIKRFWEMKNLWKTVTTNQGQHIKLSYAINKSLFCKY